MDMATLVYSQSIAVVCDSISVENEQILLCCQKEIHQYDGEYILFFCIVHLDAGELFSSAGCRGAMWWIRYYYQGTAGLEIE